MTSPPCTNPNEPEELLDYVSRRVRDPKNPLKLLVIGRAGSGKSTFIKKLLQRIDGVVETMNLASRNTAANETGGQTVFKKFHIDYRNIGKVLEAPCTYYPKLGLVILDEISLFYPALVDVLDVLISRMKKKIGQMFGDVHVILVGDFLQLPADNKNGVPMYKWLGLRKFQIRMLSTNFRQAKDGDFCQRLDRWAVGRVTKDDFDFIKERSVAKNGTTMYEEVAQFYISQNWRAVDCLILTSTNKIATNFTRMVLNARGIHEIVEIDAVVIQVIPDKLDLPVTYKPVETPIGLLLGINAPIIFTQDTHDESGNKVKKGTVGRITDFEFVENEIKSISIRIKKGAPLKFRRIIANSHKVGEATESLAIFNFRNGISTTFNQAQGRTLKKVMIDTSRGELYPAQFYTGASRVCCADALHFTYLPEEEMTSLETIINPDRGAINEHKEWRKRWKHVELPSDVPIAVQDDKENIPEPDDFFSF